MPRISSSGSATAFWRLSAGGCRKILSGRAQGPRWPVCELPRLAQHHCLQHQPGEGGGRAEEFCRSARSQWKGKIVKAHPGYSGTIMTATYQMQRDLGWSFFEQLAKQNIMQVQSSADPPKKLDLGERAVMADGNEYNIFQMKEAGRRSSRSTPRKVAADYRAERRIQGRTESECGKAVPVVQPQPGGQQLIVDGAYARCIRKPSRRRGASRSRTSRP